jgi:hypothetical protein
MAPSPAALDLIKRLAASLPGDHPLADEIWYYLRQFPPCQECGAMTPQEAKTRCLCAGDKDDCHGCDLWPDADATLAQPEPEGVGDAASRVIHYLEQRQLIRGLDPTTIHALHAGTDEPRQASLTVSDLAALAHWAPPTP